MTALGLLAVPAVASAEVIDGKTATLKGTVTYKDLSLINGATIKVLPNTGSTDMEGGRLHIKANSISIDATSKIDGIGAGFTGNPYDMSAGTGNAVPGSNGGGKMGNPFTPGSGGGYGGQGAAAADASCMPIAMISGGLAFYNANPVFELGSAGGAANVMTLGTAGASGGALITLEAAKIVIDGSVLVDGASSQAVSGLGRGAGSGGAIHILSYNLSGMGLLSAKGGNGAHGNGSANPQNPYPANNGGGGGGGVIVVEANMMGSISMNADGGSTGDCLPALAGGSGVTTFTMTTACIDADGDGFFAAECESDKTKADCDDASNTINPMAVEACDGVDNNCDGKTDEEPDASTSLCPAGKQCVMGDCVAVMVDAGSDAEEPDAGGVPDHVDFGGGCDVSGAGAAGGATFAALATMLLARVARRGKRRSGKGNKA